MIRVLRNMMVLSLLMMCSISGRVEALTIDLIKTSELTGHATGNIQAGSIVYDNTTGRYKLWTLAPNWSGAQYWSIYYSESASLTAWTNIHLQEVLHGSGTAPGYSNGREYPQAISVVKEADNSYKMWTSTYWWTTHGPWETWIDYRSSSDGISWGSSQTVLDPGNSYSAPSYSDDGLPQVVHLKDGTERMYYIHQHEDSYAPGAWTLRRVNLANNGTTWSGMTAISAYDAGSPFAATIIGDPNGDLHHRMWAIKGGNLTSFDSYNEGQTWTEQYWGAYSGDAIRGSYYDTISGTEYFIKSSGATLYLTPSPSTVPEPASFILLGTGLFSLGWCRRQRRVKYGVQCP